MTEYGSGGSFTVTMDGPFAGGGGSGESEKLAVIRTTAENWKGGTSPYYQIVSVEGVSISSKIDIYLSAEEIERLSNQRITFTAENQNGVVKVYAIGDKPASACEFQANLSPILNVSGEAIEAIRGNSVSTQAPRSDYNQKDETDSSFIKNKPELIDLDVFYMTLYSSEWSNNKQNVVVNKVVEDVYKQAILSVADFGSLEIYLDCNIRMESQNNGSITFACDDVPSSDVFVKIMILTQGG